MANQSESNHPLDKLKSGSDTSCLACASSDSEYITALASQSTTSSTMTFFSTSMSNERKVVGGEGGSVEDEIEQSKVHWSQLVEHSDSNEDEVAEVSNMKFFKSLQRHPTWGRFFVTTGELEVGEKFAEGGQAELYHVRMPSKCSLVTISHLIFGNRVVLKVFKKGTFLRDLEKQWPQGMFQYFAELTASTIFGTPRLKFFCNVLCGTLLSDGRFAFLLVRETEDLRAFIDRKMKARIDLDCGPFPMEMAFEVMYRVARGMDLLHNLDIVHRDLKASNVLCSQLHNNKGNVMSMFLVADFECSIGVVGTGFFRAPEILQALKDKVVNKRPNLFTKAGDVYGYGMLCYEILTGKLPFEGHPLCDYDLVLKGQRPEVPHYVDEWVRDLLHRCWQLDASTRPTFGEILELLETNSKECKKVSRLLEELQALPGAELYNYRNEF